MQGMGMTSDIVGCAQRGLSIGISLAALALSAQAAFAETAGDALPSVPRLDGISVTVGAIGVITPKFEGSKSYHVLGAPYIIPSSNDDGTGRFNVRSLDDFRFALIQYQGFEFGPTAGWRSGRQEKDSDRLAGLGDVDGGLVIGAYAGYRVGSVMPFLTYNYQVTGSDTGGVLRFGAETSHALTSWLRVTAVAGSTFADGRYMDSFFGVSAAQAAASKAKLGVYDAEAGIKDVYLSLTGDIRLSPAWSIKLAGQYKHLTGDAGDSPITETREQFQGLVGISYKFGVPGF